MFSFEYSLDISVLHNIYLLLVFYVSIWTGAAVTPSRLVTA